MVRLCAAAVVIAAVSAVPALGADAARPVRFNRDIRPILSDKCFACHGPDAKHVKGDLRLDLRESAIARSKHGRVAIVPGDPGASELIARIDHSDPDERMPPADSHKSLDDSEKALLRRWIEQGAAYEPHWAYAPLTRPAPPAVKATDWARGPIDRFILAELEAEGVAPNPEADRVTLIRRLSFDLTGLPPTPAEVDAFVSDTSSDAYDKVVDRLLASPHFGERLAIYWLDVVRFADTDGYHGDNPRTMWLYRDYVINAFNSDMPYDRFVVEQLAGDLLPEPTRDTRIASAFNRLLQTTQEGGAQAREYLLKYSADRVRNTSAALLGSTLGCAECHDHKYDPFTAKDFYSFAAFFADIKDIGVGRPEHTRMPTDEEAKALAALDAEIASLKAALAGQTPELQQAFAAWEAEQSAALTGTGLSFGPWQKAGPFAANSFEEAHKTDFGPEKDKAVDLAAAYGETQIKWTPQPDWADGALIGLTGENSATYVYRTVEAASPTKLVLSLGSDDSIRVWIDGELKLDRFIGRGAAPGQETVEHELAVGTHGILMKIGNAGGGYGFIFEAGGGGLPRAIADVLRKPAAERTPQQTELVAAHFRSITPLLAGKRDELKAKEAKRDADYKKAPELVITTTLPKPRETRILPRGNWLDDTGEIVQPAIPAFLGKLDTGDKPATRLDLARWVASKDNPLTSRVMVNRLWMLYFGRGISPIVDDVGSQGAPPTHADLLDHLAADFVDHGWSIKRTVRAIVTSSAYRQSSISTPQQRARDPYNAMLARQGRWRIEAEIVRDSMLAYSGLLVPKVGGPSVFPYQPAGYWMHLKFPEREWRNDTGESQHRRGLYTWWQRTFIHPAMAAFDAPTREECTAQRVRSNTPLGALALLNDPATVEAARKLAERIIREGGDDEGARIRWVFRQVVSRAPTEREAEAGRQLLVHARDHFTAEPDAVGKLLAVGQAKPDASIDPVEIAVYTQLARAILNLHETITRN